MNLLQNSYLKKFYIQNFFFYKLNKIKKFINFIKNTKNLLKKKFRFLLIYIYLTSTQRNSYKKIFYYLYLFKCYYKTAENFVFLNLFIKKNFVVINFYSKLVYILKNSYNKIYINYYLLNYLLNILYSKSKLKLHFLKKFNLIFLCIVNQKNFLERSINIKNNKNVQIFFIKNVYFSELFYNFFFYCFNT